MENSADQLAAITERAIELLTTYGMSVIGAIVILIIGWILSSWISGAVRRGVHKSEKFDKTLGNFLSDLVRYGILGFTFIAVLSRFGVQTTSLVAVFGAIGLAIGFALQGTLSNIAAGVMLLIFRPFKVDDYIDAGGTAGTVKNLNLFVTELATPDNVKIVVPNKELWDKPLSNFSIYDTRRLDIGIGIAYSDNIQTASDAMMKVMTDDSNVLTDPAPTVFVSELGDSAVVLTARLWMKRADYWQVKWDQTRAMKEALDAAGISIPFPQRDVHLFQEKAAE
jgi:small conductance mechanosensitive channel